MILFGLSFFRCFAPIRESGVLILKIATKFETVDLVAFTLRKKSLSYRKQVESTNVATKLRLQTLGRLKSHTYTLLVNFACLITFVVP